jgi:hypothetical protein
MAAGKYALDAAFFQGNRFLCAALVRARSSIPSLSRSLHMFQNDTVPPHPKTEFYFFNLWAPSHVFEFGAAAMSSKTDAFLHHASQ